MAIPSALPLITISVLLFAFNMPSALGLIVDGLSVSALNLGGVVSCPTQNIALNQPAKLLAGLPVELRCGSSGTLLKTVTTDVAGTYLFVLNLLENLLFDPSTCYVSVNIPATSCALPVPTAILKSPIVVLNVVQALLGGLLGGLLGTSNLLSAVAGPPMLLSTLTG